MDGHRVAEALGERVGHAHGKDTVFHADSLALNGLLDRRWPEPADQMPWTFAIPGRGHDLALVDRPGAGAVRVAGPGGVDRARGPVHVTRDRRP